jgi:WD40 repeat protein
MILWNLSTGQPQFETERLNGVGASVAFRPDAKEIVTGGNDDRIAIWDGHNGKLLRTFTGHQRPIMGAAYSPDGNRLVTFARDRSVRIWDPNRGRELMTVYESPPGTLTLGAQFTKDGKALALILSDGTVQIHESMPWNEHDYPTGDLQTGALPTGTLPTDDTTTSSTLTDGSTLTLRQRIELHNRRQMLGNQVTVDDLIHRPQTPTVNFRR